MESIKEYLKRSDFLGLNVNFKISKSNTYKTKLGGFLSLMIIFGTIYVFFVNLLEFVTNNDPTMQFSEGTINDKKKGIAIKNSKFFFAIQLLDDDSIAYDLHKYFIMDLIHQTETINSAKKKEEVIYNLAMKKCNMTDYNETIDFGSFNMSEYYCPDFSQVKKDFYFLYGNFGEKFFQFFSLKLKFCENTSNINQCEKYKLYKYDFKDKFNYIKILFKDVKLNPFNFKTPTEKIVATKIFKNSANLSKDITLYLKRNELLTDVGYIEKNIETQYATGIDRITTEYSQGSGALNKYFLNFEIYGNRNYKIYLRTYIKIYEILENSVIFINWMTLFMKLFYDIYNEFKFNLFLHNRLIYINNKDNEEDDDYNSSDGDNDQFDKKKFNLKGFFKELNIDKQIEKFEKEKNRNKQSMEKGNDMDIEMENNCKNIKKTNKLMNMDTPEEENNYDYNSYDDKDEKLYPKIKNDLNEKDKDNSNPDLSSVASQDSGSGPGLNSVRNLFFNFKEFFPGSRKISAPIISKNDMSKNKKLLEDEIKNLDINIIRMKESCDENINDKNNNENDNNNSINNEKKDTINTIKNDNVKEKVSFISNENHGKDSNSSIENIINNNIDGNIKNESYFPDNKKKHQSVFNSTNFRRKGIMPEKKIYLLEKDNEHENNEKIKDKKAEIVFKNLESKNTELYSYAILRYIFIRPFKKKVKKEFENMKILSEYFNSKFDIFYYFRELKNLDLLNNILFDENQLELVKFISSKNQFSHNMIRQIEKTNPISIDQFKDLVKCLDVDSIIDKKIYEEIFHENMDKKFLI
jgi:hypothetical protein